MGITPVQASPRYQHPLGMGIPPGWASPWVGHPTEMGTPPSTGILLEWVFLWDEHPTWVDVAPGHLSPWFGDPLGVGIPSGWAQNPPCTHRTVTSHPGDGARQSEGLQLPSPRLAQGEP